MRWADRIWMIGCGNMGGAVLQAWLNNGAPADNITVIKPNETPLPGGLQSQADYPDGPAPDLVILAMKPYQLEDVATKLAPLVGDNTKIISILAGTELDILRQNFPKAGRMIRLMPNMAVTVGKSPMIFIAENDDDILREEMDALFSPLGAPEWLDDESQMHVATALAGSGPAFLFRFIDALAVSAAELGMNPDQAARLALAMVDGAATLAAGSDLDPGALANQVAGRGGTTRKGLDVMDRDGRANVLLYDVLKAAMERNIEMAEEARSKI
ncbi:pyrroline-5-carboxylate reductase family protein [Parasphingorhabdus sp.]|uniref:pyrroline-5-carboxylate reductase family protein n=1 Tax=Parasphingorhabdus sp. TaxID=2709688 RepID=UPI003A8FDF13